MAKFRYAVLENDVAKSASLTSGTETIDLPEKGILSELILQARSTGAYVDNTYLPMYHILQKLEVLVDGSTVVKSLDGRQCRALMWYNNGPFGQAESYHAAGSSNKGYGQYILYFGNNANDTKMGLDLSRYANPQLKITWDAATTSRDGITYDAYASPAFTYNVMAKVFDGLPVGFQNKYVQSRQVDSWTVAASSEHATEIPRGYDLKGLMLGSRYTSVAWYDLINHVKLDFDNGKWLPLDMDYENLMAAFKCWFPQECQWGAWCDNANGDDFDTRVMQLNGMGYTAASSSIGAITWEVFEFPLYTMGKWQPDGTALSSKAQFHVNVRGWGPHQTFYIPMKQLLDGATDVVRTADYGRIDLKVETSASSGTSATSKVVAEYVKPNGQ